MKSLSLMGVYSGGLLAILLLIVVHAPLVVWLGTLLPEQSLVLKAWKELLLAVLSIIAVVLVSRRKLWPKVLGNVGIQLSLLYIVIHLALAALLGGELPSIVSGLMIDLRFIVMFVLMYTLVLLQPTIFPKVLKISAIGAVIVLVFGLLQITVLPDNILSSIGYSKNTIAPFITIDQNPDFVRINSTLRGPNSSGALLVVYGAVALAFLLRSKNVQQRTLSVLSGAASVAVLFATYSRSAYVAAVLAAGTVLVVASNISKRLLIVGGLFAIWITGLTLLSVQSDWVSNVILHEDPESTVVTKSNDEHIRSLKVGFERMITEPLGRGVGSTGSASLYDSDGTNNIIIENHYFFIAHEAGWIGLATFVTLFVYLLRQLYMRRTQWLALGLFAGGIGLAAIGLLLPVWADDTVSIIWWGLVGAVVALPARSKVKARL